jgi:hypothetical protein
MKIQEIRKIAKSRGVDTKVWPQKGEYHPCGLTPMSCTSQGSAIRVS